MSAGRALAKAEDNAVLMGTGYVKVTMLDNGTLDYEHVDPRRVYLATETTTHPVGQPHSRACGIKPHDHGLSCSRDCPTCKGSDVFATWKVTP